MPNLTLLDVARRNAGDDVVGLVEEILTVAPEFRTLPVKPRSGISYPITRRIGRATGGFRNVNEGIAADKSKYETVLVPMFFFDAQLRVDEAIVKADGGKLGDILAGESAGQLQEAYVTLGDQVYRGTTASKKGFAGFREQLDSSLYVDATGTGGTTHTAWAVFEGDQGVHCPIGNDGAFGIGQWMRQQVTDANSNPYMAWVNNLSFYVGLALGSRYAIGCVKNITEAKPLTDSLGTQLFAKFKVGRKPTRWFMSRDVVYWLQKSRSAIGQVATDANGSAFSPPPTSLAGVPIVETDSIATEAAW